MMTIGNPKHPAHTLSGAVFVNGIWKSGNHLVYSALNELGVEGPFNGIAAHLLFGRAKFAKRLLRGSWPGTKAIDVGLETEAQVRPGYLRHTLRKLEGRIVGGHAAHSEALVALLREEGARMIAIRRDPRDILVSFADWIGKRDDFFLYPDFAQLKRDERIALLLRGGEGTGYRLKPFNDVLRNAEGWLTTPEDLVGAKGGGSNTAQTDAVTALHAHVGGPKPLEVVKFEQIYGGSLTFNKGRAARWRELDNVLLVEEIVDRLGPHLATWGYTP
jgi:hypothetical protein